MKRAQRVVALDQAYEVRYWCQSLRCTEQQLRWAVQEVGPMVEAIEELLGRRAPAGEKR